jgi:hypothetical protein
MQAYIGGLEDLKVVNGHLADQPELLVVRDLLAPARTVVEVVAEIVQLDALVDEGGNQVGQAGLGGGLFGQVTIQAVAAEQQLSVVAHGGVVVGVVAAKEVVQALGHRRVDGRVRHRVHLLANDLVADEAEAELRVQLEGAEVIRREARDVGSEVEVRAEVRLAPARNDADELHDAVARVKPSFGKLLELVVQSHEAHGGSERRTNGSLQRHDSRSSSSSSTSSSRRRRPSTASSSRRRRPSTSSSIQRSVQPAACSHVAAFVLFLFDGRMGSLGVAGSGRR